MRNLIVCCDGTWNTPDQRHDGVPIPTNVVRLYHCLADKDPRGNPQVAYYHPGVGSEGNWWEKAAGGGFGLGLTKNIMSAYRWLGGQYRPGDRISLFGFSRGAYTARSLAGILTGYGLLNLRGLSEPKVWERVEAAEKAYRSQTKNRARWARGWGFHGTGARPKVPIHFLGVWDTVGALGIPNDLALMNLMDRFVDFEFHDTTLGGDTLNARHAVAIDEKRAPFSPTLWTTGHNRPTVKQIWFPGVHCDVGGGYREIGLSNGALQWMIDEAGHADIGIGFQPEMVEQIEPDFQDVMHDSFQGPMKALKSRPRSIPPLDRRNKGLLHESVQQRIARPPIAEGPYRRTQRLARGEKATFSIYALDPWNETGLYLEKGKSYRIKARGEWLDRKIRCGPGGMDDGNFQIGELAHVAGSALGFVEGIFKKVTGNEEADFKFTRRREEFDWFRLLGSIANGRVMKAGKVVPHEVVDIGSGTDLSVTKPGYLYCFANDAWGFYENNSGSVQLTVECLG